MKRLVVYSELPHELIASLRRSFEVTCFEQVDASNRAAFVDAVRQAHGLIGASVTIDRAVVEPARDLQAISTISTGIDRFDVEYLTERGIVLSHTPDVLTETTADAIFALILATARRVVELADFVRDGKWRSSIGPAQYGSNVHGKTIGILGMGRIGEAVARRARLGFGMTVLYYNRSAAPRAEVELDARRVPLEELLAVADFVCLVLPLTAETERLLGADDFARMKRSAILINGGRGAILDEAALIEALRAGTIHGAGLDVFEHEPLALDSPLLTLPNVVALPHIGSATHETRHAMARQAVENLVASLSGTPQNVANPAVLARRLTGIGTRGNET
jgi:lactate dehydrogenase-like 2-hydroxyacid dehydrogenase